MDKQLVISKTIEFLERKIQDVEKSIQQALQDAREAPSSIESHSDTSRSEKQRMAGNFENTKNELLRTIKALQKPEITQKHTIIQNDSLIESCENDSCVWYFIVPFGGGDRFTIDGIEIMTLSSESLLGKQFMNKKQNDTITLQTPKGTRTITITSVC